MSCELIHGDCLEEMHSIPDGSVDMVLADPPYGTTACVWDSIIPLEPMWAHLKRVAKPNAAIVITASQPFTSVLVCSNLKMFRYCWVWEKTQGSGFMNAKKMPIKITEDIPVFYSRLPTYNPQGLRCFGKTIKTRAKYSEQSVYGKIGLDKHGGDVFIQEKTNYPTTKLFFSCEKGLHPTQKPVPLMAYLIRTYTNEGDTVLDFCMGSGTTGVACRYTGRSFIGIEQDAEYFKIAEGRINEQLLC